MKYLTVFAVIAVAFWIWRKNRRNPPPSAPEVPRAPAPQTAVLPMLQCALCRVHLPAADALAGRQGHYCSAQHRTEREG